MTRMTPVLLLVVLVVLPGRPTQAQTASLGRRGGHSQQRGQGPALAGSTREELEYKGNPLLEANSLIAIPITPPKQFRKHDIITIIVRNQKRFEADAELESRKKFEVKSELEAFFKFIDDGIGASLFRRGKPNVDYKFESRVRNEGDSTREDSFITRVSGQIIDIKPNGNLVLEAKGRIKHDDEVAVVSVTGVVRAADVTPDNTVLSTQVADLNINVENSGAVKDAASRGWITRLMDYLKPV